MKTTALNLQEILFQDIGEEQGWKNIELSIGASYIANCSVKAKLGDIESLWGSREKKAKYITRVINKERGVQYHQDRIKKLSDGWYGVLHTDEKRLRLILEKILDTTILQNNYTVVFSTRCSSYGKKIQPNNGILFLFENKQDSLEFVCCYENMPIASFPIKFQYPAVVAQEHRII